MSDGKQHDRDRHTIEEAEECDGESVMCYGRKADSGEWIWEWVPVETLYECGREDILRYVGVIRDDDDDGEAA
jgi:hypothetical protein